MSLGLTVRKLILPPFTKWCKSSLSCSEVGGWRFVPAASHHPASPAQRNWFLSLSGELEGWDRAEGSALRETEQRQMNHTGGQADKMLRNR